MSYANVGKVWTPETFEKYLETIKAPVWASKICLHHTAAPSLAQRPKGFTIQHIVNIKDFYQNTLGWKRGPHFFVDEDQIFGMTPPQIQGTHAVSFNSSAIGIEVLGDYDTENPLAGRGLECWQTTAKMVKILAKWLNIPINEKTILFHRDDPKTTKTCPGAKIKKDWILSLINEISDKPVPKKIGEGLDLQPVAEYLMKVKKWTWADTAKALTRQGNTYYLNGKLLECAFYDTTEQTTFAPKKEIDDAIN